MSKTKIIAKLLVDRSEYEIKMDFIPRKGEQIAIADVPYILEVNNVRHVTKKNTVILFVGAL